MIEHGLNMTTILINIPKITHLSQQGLSCAVNVLLTWGIQENIPSRSGGSYSKLLLNRFASRATWCSPFNKLGMSSHGHINTAETFSPNQLTFLSFPLNVSFIWDTCFKSKIYFLRQKIQKNQYIKKAKMYVILDMSFCHLQITLGLNYCFFSTTKIHECM